MIHLRQAPAPSHMPSNPQLVCVSAAHSLSGSLPAVTGRQRPSAAPVLALAQALQRPAQAVSQQTPSTQNPLRQSVAALQRPPLPPSTRLSLPASVAPLPAAASMPAAPPMPAMPPAPPLPFRPAAPPVPETPPVPPVATAPASPPAPTVPPVPVPPVLTAPPPVPSLPASPAPPSPVPPVPPPPPPPQATTTKMDARAKSRTPRA